MPHDPLQDGPLAGVVSYDLSAPGGLALLRRFDAGFHRLPPEARDDAARRLPLRLPLAERAEGLLVLPGGALAWRDNDGILLPDPGSAIGVTALAPALRRLALAAPGATALHHAADGLRLGSTAATQCAVLLASAAVLAPLLPAVAEWRGPALLHGHPGGAVLWELVPAPPALALAASLCGETIPESVALPRHLWAMGADDRYQHLSAGLAQHLDEYLAAEISDALRFALIGHWTDGESSEASRLADGLGLLPAGFGPNPGRPPAAGMAEAFPRAAAALPAGHALLGLAGAEAPERWDAARRQSFLQRLRAQWPEALLLGESSQAAPLPLDGLAADRLARTETLACAALLPLVEPMAPGLLLQQAGALAQMLDAPLLLSAPCWGLGHWLDGGGGRGNGPGFGTGAALELFDED
jgi:hypothetical protein